MRRAAKSSNKYGSPIVLKSKILAVAADPHSPSSTVYVTESSGAVRKVNVNVCVSPQIYIRKRPHVT